MNNTNHLPRKIASVAVWMIAIPVLVVATVLHGQKEPTIKN